MHLNDLNAPVLNVLSQLPTPPPPPQKKKLPSEILVRLMLRCVLWPGKHGNYTTNDVFLILKSYSTFD